MLERNTVTLTRNTVEPVTIDGLTKAHNSATSLAPIPPTPMVYQEGPKTSEWWRLQLKNSRFVLHAYSYLQCLDAFSAKLLLLLLLLHMQR